MLVTPPLSPLATAMALMKLLPLAATWALLAVAPMPALASSSDCDGESARTLHAATYAATDARAYWLDAGTIRWPKMPAGSRYLLYAAADAGLRVERGQSVRGADAAITLEPAATLAEDAAARFRFTGVGVELRLPEQERPRIAELLRGQILLVQEDAQGRVPAIPERDVRARPVPRHQRPGPSRCRAVEDVRA